MRFTDRWGIYGFTISKNRGVDNWLRFSPKLKGELVFRYKRDATVFASREEAESVLLLLVARIPDFMGHLEVRKLR